MTTNMYTIYICTKNPHLGKLLQTFFAKYPTKYRVLVVERRAIANTLAQQGAGNYFKFPVHLIDNRDQLKKCFSNSAPRGSVFVITSPEECGVVNLEIKGNALFYPKVISPIAPCTLSGA